MAKDKVVTAKVEEFCRPQVVAFALAMEAKLRQKDYRGKHGWRECATNYLFERFEEETQEALEVMKTIRQLKRVRWDASSNIYGLLNAALKIEVVDMANFLMMLFDVLTRETAARKEE